MKLTEEQRATHIGNSDCGVLTLTQAIAQDLQAIADHVSRYVFPASEVESVMESLQLAHELIRPSRDVFDLHVTAFAMASLDKLKEDPGPDEFDE